MRIRDWSSDVCSSDLVALRAAFVAAMAGLQVAIVCPTTLLARQHYQNFTARFEGLPLRIGRLSRLVPGNEAKATREGITDGTIDIVIGTHAVLAKKGRAHVRTQVTNAHLV